MTRRTLLYTGLFVLFFSLATTGLAAESELEDDGVEQVSMNIGDVRSLSPMVRNLLSQPDTIHLNFTGTATDDVVSWEVTPALDDAAITCWQTSDRVTETYGPSPHPQFCEVDVEAQSSETIDITLHPKGFGQGSFVIDATSQVTKLTGSDSVQVQIDPRYSNSRQATALTPLYIGIIMFTAVLVYWRRY